MGEGRGSGRSASGIDLFSIAGIRIVIDYSWFIVFFLVAWLHSGVVRQWMPRGTGEITIWTLSLLTSLLLFVCVLLHELSHSLIAIWKGTRVPRITLFIFGGVSHLAQEPKRPADEFKLAIAGPLASFVIALLSGLALIVTRQPERTAGYYLLSTMTLINAMLGLFNLLPAFPLDGGRVLRSWLWHQQGSFTRATVIASRVGRGIAFGLIGLGLMSVLIWQNFGGLWMVLIGLFLNQAAGASAERALIRQTLKGTLVRRIMSTPVVTLEPHRSLADAVENTFLRHHFVAYPVTRDGEVEGVLALKDVKKYPREEWTSHTVAEAMTPLAEVELAHPMEDVVNVLERMLTTGMGRMPVVEGGLLAGMLTRRDIMDFLRVQTDLSDSD